MNIKLTHGEWKGTDSASFHSKLKQTETLLGKIEKTALTILSKYEEMRNTARSLEQARDFGEHFLLLLKIFNDQDWTIPQFKVNLYYRCEGTFEYEVEMELVKKDEMEITDSESRKETDSRAVVMMKEHEDILGVIFHSAFPKLIEISKCAGVALTDVYETRQIYLAPDQFGIMSRCVVNGAAEESELVSVYWIDGGYDSHLPLTELIEPTNLQLIKSASCLTWIRRATNQPMALGAIIQVVIGTPRSLEEQRKLTRPKCNRLIHEASVEILERPEVKPEVKPKTVQIIKPGTQYQKARLVLPIEDYTPNDFTVRLPDGEEIKIDLDLQSSHSYSSAIWPKNVFARLPGAEVDIEICYYDSKNRKYFARSHRVKNMLQQEKLLFDYAASDSEEESVDIVTDKYEGKGILSQGKPDRQPRSNCVKFTLPTPKKVITGRGNTFRCTGVKLDDGRLSLITIIEENVDFLTQLEEDHLKSAFDKSLPLRGGYRIYKQKTERPETFRFKRVKLVEKSKDGYGSADIRLRWCTQIDHPEIPPTEISVIWLANLPTELKDVPLMSLTIVTHITDQSEADAERIRKTLVGKSFPVFITKELDQGKYAAPPQVDSIRLLNPPRQSVNLKIISVVENDLSHPEYLIVAEIDGQG